MAWSLQCPRQLGESRPRLGVEVLGREPFPRLPHQSRSSGDSLGRGEQGYGQPMVRMEARRGGQRGGLQGACFSHSEAAAQGPARKSWELLPEG